MVSIVIGGHFGDEGKGKLVSYLALNDNPSIIARSGVGPNAGHTVYKDGKKYGLRMIPCGFVNPNARLVIGAGVLVYPPRFLEEVELTGCGDRIRIDSRCGIIENKHKETDKADKHLSDTVGTTGSGSGPANCDRANRTIKLAKDVPELEPYLTDVSLEVNEAIDRGEEVIIEASQGFGLSLFYGTYPYVTSKDTTASMAATDVGIGPTKVDDVLAVYKAYTTRVGEGPFETELDDSNISGIWPEVLERAQKEGIKEASLNETIAKYLGEFGTTTGRMRRVGDFDYKLAKYSAMVNGATMLGLTCLDKLYPETTGVTDYDKLSDRAKEFIEKVDKEVGVKVKLISTGPNTEDQIDLR